MQAKGEIAKGRATPRLAAGGDRLRTLLDRLVISSERKIELPPYREPWRQPTVGSAEGHAPGWG